MTAASVPSVGHARARRTTRPRPAGGHPAAPEAEGLPSGWRAVVPDLRPLRRHRDYRLPDVGQSVSFFGSMVTYVAVPYQVFELTGSSLAVGLVGVVQMVAILAPRLPRRGAGRRRRPPPAGAPGRGRPAGLLRRRSWSTPPSTARRSGRSSSWPGRMPGSAPSSGRPSQGLVPRLVERDELTAAGAIDALTRTVGMIGGPAFAGLLLAGPGLEVAYAVDAATFAVSLVALTLMRAVPAAARGRAAQPAAGGGGPALRPQPAGAHRHLPGRHGGHVLRDAHGPLPGPGRALRRLGGPRRPLRRPLGGGVPGHRDQRLDGPGAPPRPGHLARRRPVGRGHHRIRPGAVAVAGAPRRWPPPARPTWSAASSA